MAMGYAAANLGLHTTQRNNRKTLLGLLLQYETWLERRRTSKILYRLDDHALADIGLSRADVEGLNASWQDHLPPSMSR
ncbi:uncharacterized protein YjiS (DUF1127 family) [Microvirga flocculans]|uniref:Uncharacterized protein YjiS (DUF1127 family) n=1 Tax=Microvirga flocculans TaxID=217168 RepID=A0A7W6ICY6_9HYPH|nr:DUF1127 domain-containing protein [Microvirga flocculans]MBB4038861.1 uncharacterized protein YjiS (DUF1127 family) [Microvirga flocculans]